MRKKLFPFITILTLALFLGACNSEDVMPEIGSETNPELTERTISFTASMPGEDDPATRVSAAEEADRGITLTWDENDKLDLLFVQGENKFHESTTVTNIENGGKNATFTVPLPNDLIDSEQYNLYGVYGGGEVSTTNREFIELPAIEGTTLNEENVGKKVMLRFAKTVDATGVVGTVNFQHVGFLFTTKIKVTGGTLDDITSVQLVGADTGNETWAYNASENYLNVEEGTFTANGTGTNAISFQNSEKDAANNVLTVRNWFPATETAWPALKLSINGTNETADAKPARTPEVGKAYYLYATWNGTDLVFADKDFNVPVVPGDGTKENPYSVEQAFANQGDPKNTDYVWVRGYIVGYKNNGGYNVEFSVDDGASGTNIVIADNVDEADGTKALGVQLPAGAARTNLNLASNPYMYKAEVLLYGTLEKYFGSDEGLKNVEEYEIISQEPFFEADKETVEFGSSLELTETIAISTNDTQAWTATSSDESWLTVDPTSETGSGDVEITATENTEATNRTATVTLTPKGNAELTPIVVTVTQAAFEATIVVDPTELSFSSDAGSETIAVTANVEWTASSDAGWATISPASGTNNGTITVNVNVEANKGEAERTATITITGGGIDKTVAVTQAAEGADVATDLFFSEYVHGSGVNKYLEIYNGTGVSIDLSNYVVKAYMNGNTSANTTLELSGTIADGEVIIISDPGATAYTGTVHFKSNAAQFNGDDAIALEKTTGEKVDIIGHIGERVNWEVKGITTSKKTLVRKPDVKEGVSSSTSGFPELGTQWTQYPQSTYSYLGIHTMN